MNYKTLPGLALVFCTTPSYACITCNKEIQEGIWNSTFYPNLLTMLSAFIVLAAVVGFLTVVSLGRYRKLVSANRNLIILSPVPLTTASIISGIGLGGFADGIVLHQILQWHQMLSNKIPSTDYIGKSVNMFWDGIFHLFCMIVTLSGIALLWKVSKRNDIEKSGRLLGGGMLIGWALFNIVEGIINHHLLELHYVMQFSANPNIANAIFLIISVVILVIGWVLVAKTPAHRSNVSAS